MKKKEKRTFGNTIEYYEWVDKQLKRSDNYLNGCFWCFCFACLALFIHWSISVVLAIVSAWGAIMNNKIMKEIEDAQEEWRNRK